MPPKNPTPPKELMPEPAKEPAKEPANPVRKTPVEADPFAEPDKAAPKPAPKDNDQPKDAAPAKEAPKPPPKANPNDADPFAAPGKAAADAPKTTPVPIESPTAPKEIAKPDAAKPAKPTDDDPFGDPGKAAPPAPNKQAAKDSESPAADRGVVPASSNTPTVPAAKPIEADIFADPPKPATDNTKDAPPAPKADVKPADVKPADETSKDPFADPIPKKTDAAPAPAEKQAAAEEPVMRAWQDDTGEYHIRGKLVKIMEGKVRLLKDTGKFTTVPMDRLSQADLRYVQQQIAAAQPGLVGQTAQQ